MSMALKGESKHWLEMSTRSICDDLRYLAPFARFKKREKHPWRSVTFSKVADFSLEL